MEEQRGSNVTDRNWQRPTLRRLSAARYSAVGSSPDVSERTFTVSGNVYRYFPVSYS